MQWYICNNNEVHSISFVRSRASPLVALLAFVRSCSLCHHRSISFLFSPKPSPRILVSLLHLLLRLPVFKLGRGLLSFFPSKWHLQAPKYTASEPHPRRSHTPVSEVEEHHHTKGLQRGPLRVVNEKVIGIDSGAINSAVAAMEGRKPTIITNAEGQRTTPFVVVYTENGDKLVGQIAKQQSGGEPREHVLLGEEVHRKEDVGGGMAPCCSAISAIYSKRFMVAVSGCCG